MVPQVAAGELGVAQADAAQRLEQHIGEGREPQPELVGAHGGRRGAVGEQIELLLLDPVLHLAAGAVDVLVQGARVDRAGAAARSRRSAGWRPWAGARPWRPPGAAGSSCRACARRSRRSGGPGRPGPSSRPRPRPNLRAIGADQALVAREAEDVIDAVRLAPGHQLVAGKARIGAQQDLHPRPARADLGDDARRPPRPRRPRRRCWSAGAWPRAGAGRRRRTAADSSSSRSSRGRSGPPGGRAADRRWRRGRE